MAPTDTWTDLGFTRGDEYHIVRGPWKIARCMVGSIPKYALFRGSEHHGVFPDAHEAAVHADMVEAGKA